MSDRSPLPLILAAAGAILAAAGLLVDVFGMSAPGFGKRQIAMVVVGIAMVLMGLPRTRAKIIGAWRAMPKTTTTQCVALGTWFGLVTGFVETAHQLVRVGFGKVLARPIDHIWIAPLLYMLAFTIIAIAFAPIRKLLPRLFTFPVQVFLWLTLLVWSQCLFHPSLDVLAVFVLSVGIAFQGARMANRHRKAFVWLFQRSLILLLGGLIVSAALVRLQQLGKESSMLANLPRPPAEAPNVVLVSLDTVRADHLELYGHQFETMPALTRLAERGVVFERAMTTSPWTLPSHATLFTGLYHHDTSADWLTPLDEKDPTLAEALGKLGYATGAFIGNLNYCSAPHGVDRGFCRFDDFPLTPEVMAFSTILGEWMWSASGLNFINKIRNDADHITTRCLDWIDELKRGEEQRRPFFAFLNYFDAHAQYFTHPDFQSKFHDGLTREFVSTWYGRREWTEEDMVKFRAAYDGCISFIDFHLGRLIQGLEQRGLLDNTLLIVTADHGEQFGEHDLLDHSNSLYGQLLHAPLVIHFPGQVPSGMRIEDFASIRDIPATILDFAGATGQPLPGGSLSRFWSQDPVAMEYVGTPVLSEVSKGIRRPPNEPVSKGDMASLFEGRFHLIRNGDGTFELYDYFADPAEERDLVGDPAHAGTLRAMRPKLEAAVRVR